ncbi:MAG: hypothetical protein ABR587_04380 [Candidatus Binatia bacterium]
MAKVVSGYTAAVSKVVLKCNDRRSQGLRALSEDCNDVSVADTKGDLTRRRNSAKSRILEDCAGAESLLSGYVGCPAPAATADNGGATGGIDSFSEVADCLLALTDAHAGQLFEDVQGSPDEVLLDPLRKCQKTLGKGVTRIVRTYMKEGRRCQQDADTAGGGVEYSCEGVDPKGRLVKSRLKFVDKAERSCSYSPEVIRKLDACADDAANLLICADASADSHGDALTRAIYELDGGTSTTTTTMPGDTTTTTLPDGACGDTFPECNGACPSNSTCLSSGSQCSCVPDADGPCAPATIIRTIHGKYGAIPSETSLSTGWSGKASDVEIPDLTGDTVDVTCDEHCENCDITMNVQAGEPESNCRCTSNVQTTCTVINGSDVASCGSLDPTCRCYFGSPLPLSSGGTPACVVNRIRQDYDGTMDLRTGVWNDEIRLASVVYLGLSQTAPCPTCNGDPTPNDGVRGGTCAGGLGGGSCDANGVHATFGATSWDCLPTTAANISGTGLLINLNSSTGSQSLTASVPCDTPSGEDCPCRICSGNGNLGCSSDADCAAAGAGTCTDTGGAGVVLNQCDGFACDASGVCASGPVDTYCDGLVHPDGRGFIPCTGDSDCSASSAGTCTNLDVRRCFPDPILTSGSPDRYAPVTSGLFCIAPTSNFAVNVAAGLPGPGELTIDFTSDIRCQNDPDLVYEFPAGANCGTAGTTTTTLLVLPECEDSESPVCGGLCPPGQLCADSGGTCACTGVPLPACAEAAAPVCGGFCSDLNDVCTDNGGTCECEPVTLPQCSEAAAPLCGGLCPTGEICTNVGDTCECGAPGVPTCANSLSPTCGGECDVGSICVDMSGTCGCTSLGLPTCAEADSPVCLGTCALGSLCQDVLGACQCVTAPLP